MSTIIPLIAICLLSLWLLLRVLAVLHSQARGAAILAQLEAMDADWTRFELESAKSDRELRKLQRALNPLPPESKRSKRKPHAPNQIHDTVNSNPCSNPPSDQQLPLEDQTSVSAAPQSDTPQGAPCETSRPKPTRKREISRPPQTLEEYEANRKRLPPPNYNPNSRASQLFDQLYKGLPPVNVPVEISVNSSPFAVQPRLKPKQHFLSLCLTPLRLAARLFHVAIKPVLQVRIFAASFFTRPKPRPPADTVSNNRAA